MALINGIQPYAPKIIDEETFHEFLNNVSDNADRLTIEKLYKKNTKESPDGLINEYVLQEPSDYKDKLAIYDATSPTYYKILGRASYSMYTFPNEEEYLKLSTDNALCAKALTKGFENIIILDQGGDNNINKRLLSCK
jgi:hypothetical protein